MERMVEPILVFSLFFGHYSFLGMNVTHGSAKTFRFSFRHSKSIKFTKILNLCCIILLVKR